MGTTLIRCIRLLKKEEKTECWEEAVVVGDAGTGGGGWTLVMAQVYCIYRYEIPRENEKKKGHVDPD